MERNDIPFCRALFCPPHMHADSNLLNCSPDSIISEFPSMAHFIYRNEQRIHIHVSNVSGGGSITRRNEAEEVCYKVLQIMHYG